MRFFICILIITLFSSCSYYWEAATDVNGKKFVYKEYKNFRVAEKMRRRQIFKIRDSLITFSKYNGKLSSDTVHSSTYIQFDSDRVYLFGDANAYKELFTSGLISSQIIYCLLDSNCRPVPDWQITDTVGRPIVQDLWGWTGHTITIDYIKLLSNVQSKGSQRRFEIWVYPFKWRMNGCNNVFFLELTNETARKSTPLSEFIKGAHITLLRQGWIMI